jgi:hypothetical protein
VYATLGGSTFQSPFTAQVNVCLKQLKMVTVLQEFTIIHQHAVVDFSGEKDF